MIDMFGFRKILAILAALFVLSMVLIIAVWLSWDDESGQALKGIWLSQIDSLGRGESERWFISGFDRNRWYEKEISQVKERHAVPDEPHAIVWYAKKFDLAEKPEHARICFAGSDDDMKIWINGVPAGLHIGYDDEFSVDASAALQNGSNEIVLELINHSGSANFYAPVKLIPVDNDQETQSAAHDAVHDSSLNNELSDAVLCEADLRLLPAGSSFTMLRKIIPDLKRSGITLLCLSPLHPAGQLNRRGAAENPYSVQDYYGINEEYGNLDDLKSLIRESHSSGIKVIMDFVVNCTSWDNSLLMQYPEWYVHKTKRERLSRRMQVQTMLQSSIITGTSCENI